MGGCIRARFITSSSANSPWQQSAMEMRISLGRSALKREQGRLAVARLIIELITRSSQVGKGQDATVPADMMSGTGLGVRPRFPLPLAIWLMTGRSRHKMAPSGDLRHLAGSC